jgi:hypothetical protein
MPFETTIFMHICNANRITRIRKIILPILPIHVNFEKNITDYDYYGV